MNTHRDRERERKKEREREREREGERDACIRPCTYAHASYAHAYTNTRAHFLFPYVQI
jgi:hypothetical protein